MAKLKLSLELITPEAKLLSIEADHIYVPGKNGDLGIFPGHAPLICELHSGELSYFASGRTEYWAIGNGFMRIRDNKVNIITDFAEFGKDIKLEEVLARKEKADKELNQIRKQDKERMMALKAKLDREIARIRVANRYL